LSRATAKPPPLLEGAAVSLLALALVEAVSADGAASLALYETEGMSLIPRN
jgi:hypothetical protein